MEPKLQITEQPRCQPKICFKIKILNYYGTAKVVVSCVTKDEPYKEHPHTLDGTGCENGIYTNEVEVKNDSVISFPDLEIKYTEKKNIKKSLNLRKSLDVVPFRNGFDLEKEFEMSVVRLCFQASVTDTSGHKMDLEPVVSSPVQVTAEPVENDKSGNESNNEMSSRASKAKPVENGKSGNESNNEISLRASKAEPVENDKSGNGSNNNEMSSRASKAKPVENGKSGNGSKNEISSRSSKDHGCMPCQCQICMGNLFNRYGRIVAQHPWWFIIVPVIICGLFGIGLIKLSNESDLETLYVPMNSQSEADRTTVEKLFPDKTDSNYFVQSLARLNMYGDIIFKSKIGSNALTFDVIEEISRVVSKVKEFAVNISSSEINYSKVCAVLGGQCYITGEYILDPNFLSLCKSGNITYPIWANANGTREDLSQSLNGASENGILKSVITIKIIFNLRQTDVSKSKKWEEMFVNEMSKLTTNLTDLVYSTSTSLDKELSANTGQDITWFSLSFTALIVYASFVASSGNCVANRSHLARAGVIGVAFAILASFGFCAPIVNFVDIVGVMPFLALGVGIDSMFVIMSEWAEHYNENSVEDQMGATLEKCGGSISIASLTDIIAFLIGVSSSFISIRNFCVYTAMALCFSFVLHLTFFLGCLALHGRRVRENRHCVTCQKIGDKNRCKDEWKTPSKREDDESLCEKLPQLLLRISVSRPIMIFVKIVIILLFLGYLGASGWGIYNLRQGLLLSNLVDEKSYFYSYQIWNRENYQMVLPISLIFKNVDYLDPNQVSDMEKVLYDVQEDSIITNGSLICWFNVFKSSVSGFDSSTDRTTFIAQLQGFLSQAIIYSNDVTFTSNNTDILASRCHFLTEDIPDSTDQGNLMLRLREITAKSDLNVFPYSAAFIFFEQYVAVLPSTLQTMGIAVACMFVITILFMPHPIMVTLVTLNMFSILAGILGFLYYWDLSLSSITMIHLIMSVGFSVDFSVHICHGYISSNSNTRNEMTKDALRVSVSPILNGGISSLLGICTLIWSQSYVFRSFFKIMVLVITFGLAHSLLLLPVFLSICGPVKTDSNRVQEANIEEAPTEMNRVTMDMKTQV